MAEVITMVKTISQVQFLGVHGQQLAVSQGGGLEFKETNKGISVTSKHHPGKRYVVYNANIAHVEYKEVPE
jgi:hypothetical protein